jgi:hypothetical protein
MNKHSLRWRQLQAQSNDRWEADVVHAVVELLVLFGLVAGLVWALFPMA